MLICGKVLGGISGSAKRIQTKWMPVLIFSPARKVRSQWKARVVQDTWEDLEDSEPEEDFVYFQKKEEKGEKRKLGVGHCVCARRSSRESGGGR